MQSVITLNSSNGKTGDIGRWYIIQKSLSCTHCAIVWRASKSRTTNSILQQLWSLQTGQLLWSHVGEMRDIAIVVTPSFSSDGHYVGFIDLAEKDLLYLIAIPPEDAIRIERIRVQLEGTFLVQQLAIGSESKRIALTQSNSRVDRRQGGSLTTVENSNRAIDS